MKLNKIEKLKSELSPFAFHTKIDQLDFENLTEADRFYLKNYGIYNIKLRPENFMIRLRITGGRISAKALEELAEIARIYNGELLLTARSQIELHGLLANNVLEIWKLLKLKGFTTLQTLTDNFRNIVTDPFDGVDESSKFEVYPYIEKMQKLFLAQKEWMGMIPRKFNTAISATQKSNFHFFGNDLCFALAKKENVWGFNVYVGGKNSEVARDADIFVEPHKSVEMFYAVIKVYKKYGLRGSRAKTRLFHLLNEIGISVFRQKIAEFYPFELQQAGSLEIENSIQSSYIRLADGRYGYRYQSQFGKIDITEIRSIAAYAQKEQLEIRLGVDQNIYLLGLKKPSVPFTKSNNFARVTACAGSRYCALSLWEVKSETSYIPLKLLAEKNISVGFSGCLKGCGRHHHEDIGLVGLRTNLFGPVVKAARVFLGTEYTQKQKPARLIFHVVPLTKLSELIGVIVEEFTASKESDFESFSRNCLNRYSSGFLMLWFLCKLYLPEDIVFGGKDEHILYQMLLEQDGFPEVEEKSDGYESAVRLMLHALWDIKEIS
jgi:ferredoxin-nitrite reductase